MQIARPVRSHAALKIVAVVIPLLIVDLILDVLPYYGVCSVEYEAGYLDLGALFRWVLLLGLLGWTGADIWTWIIRAPERDHWSGAPLAALALIVAVWGGSWLVAELQTNAVEQFIEQMQPTVSDIDAHVAQHGSPPQALTNLAAPPPTEICSDSPLVYKADGNEWSIDFWLVESSFRGEWIRYRSDGQYKEHEQILQGWAWGRWVD